MRIVSVSARPIRLPLARPMSLLGGTRTSLDNVIVEIQTDGGIVGLGEATPRPSINGESVESVVRSIHDDLGPALVGSPPADLRDFHQRLLGVAAPAGARAATEVAMLDVLSRLANVPAHRYLGSATDRLVVSALLTFGPPESVLEEARRMISDHGLRCFKLKIGKDVAADESIARTLRAELPDATLYADANGGYDLESALRFAAVARELAIEMIEEPVALNRPDWQQRMALEPGVLVVGDESCATVEAATSAISERLVGGVALKLNRTGVTGTAEIRACASHSGARTLMGFESTSVVGAAASLAFGAADPATATQPAELLSYTTLAANPAAATFTLTDGYLIASSSPGLGIEVDSDALRRFLAPSQ